MPSWHLLINCVQLNAIAVLLLRNWTRTTLMRRALVFILHKMLKSFRRWNSEFITSVMTWLNLWTMIHRLNSCDHLTPMNHFSRVFLLDFNLFTMIDYSMKRSRSEVIETRAEVSRYGFFISLLFRFFFQKFWRTWGMLELFIEFWTHHRQIFNTYTRILGLFEFFSFSFEFYMEFAFELSLG